MKVLFYHYGSICEPFIRSAFLESGIDVTDIEDEVTNKSILQSDCVKRVSQALMNGNFDFVFTINFFPTISDTCNIFKIPYIGWTVDAPVMELYSQSITNSCNYIFLFDQLQYQDIAPLNPGHIFYLPLATDVAFMQSAIAKDVFDSRLRADLSFVGSLYTEKCPYDKLQSPSDSLRGYLDGIMEAQLKVYGYYFIEDLLTDDIVADFKRCMPDYLALKHSPFLTDSAIISKYYIGNKISSLERVSLMKQLSKRFPMTIYTNSDTSGIPGIDNRGGVMTRTEMPLVFHYSTINLNMTSKGIRSGIPLRIWDILGCGGFVISNYQPEIPEYFSIGEDIEVYESADDLLYKCSYYLDHPERAREIAVNGLENVKNKHTYLHRVLTMLETVFSPKNA